MVQFNRAKALKYRDLMNQSANSLTDEQAATVPMLTQSWVVGISYSVGDRVCYDEKLYKVLQAHTSQSNWTPDVAVSLYAEVLIPDPSVIPEWVQPSSTNPYMKGDKVRHNGKKWESAVDNNVWEPGAVGTESIWIEF